MPDLSPPRRATQSRAKATNEELEHLQAAGYPPPTVRIGCIASHTIGTEYCSTEYKYFASPPLSAASHRNTWASGINQTRLLNSSLPIHSLTDQDHGTKTCLIWPTGLQRAAVAWRKPPTSSRGAGCRSCPFRPAASFASFQIQRTFAMSEYRGAV